MLRQRALTAIVLLSLFIAGAFLLPNRWWAVAVLAIVFCAGREWGRLASLGPRGAAVFAAGICSFAAAMLVIDSAALGATILCASVLFWLLCVPFWLRSAYTPSVAKLAAAGLIVMLSAWYALVQLQLDPLRMLFLVAVVWIADSAAYFVGRKFGQHKLAPAISPGKTWEGVAGAGAAVAVYYAVFWWLISPATLAPSRMLDAGLVSCIAALSIVGDLFESWMKRRAGVKDSGHILPGHGGVLDRIDGLLAALPLAALASGLTRG